MNRKGKTLLACVLLTIAMLACNLPASGPGSQPDLAATITAQAELLQQQPAIQAPPVAPVAITDTPVSTPTVALTPTITSTPTNISTPTLAVPMISVGEATNCRAGPGKNYDIVGALLVGQTAQVVAKNTSTNYWIIKNPNGAGNCWLWGNYAKISGDTSALTEMEIPPVPTALFPTHVGPTSAGPSPVGPSPVGPSPVGPSPVSP